MRNFVLALVIAVASLAANAQSGCLPKEAEGTGTAIRKWAEPKTYRGLIAWTCPDKQVVWYGVFDTGQYLAVPRTPEKVRAWLQQHKVWNEHAGDWLRGLAEFVSLAKENTQ